MLAIVPITQQMTGIVGAYSYAWVIRRHFLFHFHACLSLQFTDPVAHLACFPIDAPSFSPRSDSSVKDSVQQWRLPLTGTRCQPGKSLPDDATSVPFRQQPTCKWLSTAILTWVVIVEGRFWTNPIFINTTKIDYFLFAQNYPCESSAVRSSGGTPKEKEKLLKRKKWGNLGNESHVSQTIGDMSDVMIPSTDPAGKTPNQGNVFVKHTYIFPPQVHFFWWLVTVCAVIIFSTWFGCCAVWCPGRCILYRPSLFTFAGCRPYETSHTHSPHGRICKSFRFFEESFKTMIRVSLNLG